MKFEERFPSLVSKEIKQYSSVLLSRYSDEMKKKVRDEGCVFKLKDIRENCLDKKKVEEAIHAAVLGVRCPNDDYLKNMAEYILKELGL